MGRRYFIVGTFFGIQLRIDYSWFVIFALIAWSVITSYLPSETHGLSDIVLTVAGLVVTIIVFVSLIAHEYAHSIVANHLGLKVKRITLFIFGGASELQHEPDSARTELLMTIVGPLTSLAIAGLFWLLWVLGRHAHLTALIVVSRPVAIINLLLGLFNLLPAYPLDGGRIFRSIVWLIRKDFMKATKIATDGGVMLSYFLIALGLLALLGGDIIGGLWFAIIGFFLNQSARYSYRETLDQQILEGVNVSEVINKDFVTVALGTPVRDFLTDFVLRYKQYDFLVQDKKGSISGIIELARVSRVNRIHPQVVIDDYVQPLAKDLILKTSDSAAQALQTMHSHNLDILPVMANQELLGIVTRRYLEDYVLVHRLQNQ